MPDPTNPSIEAFLRFVNERFDDFKQRLNELLAVLGLQSQQDKIVRAKAALDASMSLKQALALQDCPNWLEPLTRALVDFCNAPSNTRRTHSLLTAIGRYYGAAIEHKWSFDFSGDKPFDFDALYRHYKSESRIPELTDKLVELLEQIVQAKKIDSLKIVHSLETIIATLKRNRKGSYFSVVCTWDFAASYLKNIAWEVFEGIPVLGAPVKALRSTMEEMDKEMDILHSGMQAELHEQLEAEFPALVYRPLALPGPERPALADQTVVDVKASVDGGE